MPDGGLDGIALPEETSHGFGLGRRLHNHQLSGALFFARSARCAGRGGHPGMCFCTACAEHGGPADRAFPARNRRARLIKRGLRLGNLAFCFAFHTISFHKDLLYSSASRFINSLLARWQGTKLFPVSITFYLPRSIYRFDMAIFPE